MLALKCDQSTLAEQMEEAFIDADACDYDNVQSGYLKSMERADGRRETCCY